MHRTILFLACSGLVVLESTALLVGWLWLMARNVPGLLHADYWWSALILGCAGLAATALGVWMWYEICRFLLPGGPGWPTEASFRRPHPGFSLFLLAAFAVVFVTADYIYCWISDSGYHPAGVALAVLVQTLAILIPSSYRSQEPEKLTPLLVTAAEPERLPEPVTAAEPEIGFERG